MNDNAVRMCYVYATIYNGNTGALTRVIRAGGGGGGGGASKLPT